MRFTRREFLTQTSMLLGGLALGYPSLSFANHFDQHVPQLVVGSDNKVCAINLKTQLETTVEVPFRVHSCVQNPLNPNRFVSIEKWGTSTSEVDFQTQTVTNNLECPANCQYSGHGYYTQNGDVLFLTVADYTSGKGYLTGYDTRNYKRISHDQISLGNLHDMHRVADGKILIASDGTYFEKDMVNKKTKRLEAGAILEINPSNNHVINRFEIPDADQVLGHFKVAKQGHIFAVAAPTPDNPSNKGNLYFKKSGDSAFHRVVLPDEVYASINGELLSIAFDEANHIALITNPHGRGLIFVDSNNGQFLHFHKSTRFSNVGYDPISKKFIIGGKKLAQIDPTTFALSPYNVPNLHTPIPYVKDPGMLNGAHSLVV